MKRHFITLLLIIFGISNFVSAQDSLFFYKSGKITQKEAFGQLEELKPKLRHSICAPAMLQQIHPTNRERKPYPFSLSRF